MNATARGLWSSGTTARTLRNGLPAVLQGSRMPPSVLGARPPKGTGWHPSVSPQCVRDMEDHVCVRQAPVYLPFPFMPVSRPLRLHTMPLIPLRMPKNFNLELVEAIELIKRLETKMALAAHIVECALREPVSFEDIYRPLQLPIIPQSSGSVILMCPGFMQNCGFFLKRLVIWMPFYFSLRPPSHPFVQQLRHNRCRG